MTHTIHIPVWDTHLHILIPPYDLRADLAAVGVTGEDADDMMDPTNHAVTWINAKDESVIVLRKWKGEAALVGLLAHEIFHAAHDILSSRGVKLRDGDANEPQAYLIGYLMEEIVKRGIDKVPQVGQA